MSILLQQIAIGLALAGAVTYLVIYYVRRRKKEGACESCRLLKEARKSRHVSPR